jgi:hypothetical protein
MSDCRNNNMALSLFAIAASRINPYLLPSICPNIGCSSDEQVSA